jgi:hypothetical protein
MTNLVSFRVTPTELMGEVLEDAEEIGLLQEMLQSAIHFMSQFPWRDEILTTHFGSGVGKIFAVFLFEIKHKYDPTEDLMWVIVGDIPPAYLVGREGPEDPPDALATYIELMEEWVDAVRSGKPTDDLIPVNVPPTRTYAEQLASRLDYLREHFLD